MANKVGQSTNYQFIFNTDNKNHPDSLKWLENLGDPNLQLGSQAQLLEISGEDLTVIKSNFPQGVYAWSSRVVSQNLVTSIEMGDEDPITPKVKDVEKPTIPNMRAFALKPKS